MLIYCKNKSKKKIHAYARCDASRYERPSVRGQIKCLLDGATRKILFLRGGNFEIKAKFCAQKLDRIVAIVSPRTLRTTRTLSLPLNYAFIRRLSDITAYFLHYTQKYVAGFPLIAPCKQHSFECYLLSN